MKNIVYKDLFYVIVIGTLVAILTGIAVGLVDYLLFKLAGFTMNIFFLFGAYFIASYIRRQYFESIKLYQIVAVIVTMFGFFFSKVVFLVLTYDIRAFSFFFKYIFSIQFMINYFDPRNLISGGFSVIISYLFIFIFGYIAYTKTK
jgi:hypothetical protein